MGFALHAFTIVVPDYDQALEFYCTTLGFDKITDQDQGNGKRWVMVAPHKSATVILLAKATTNAQHQAIGNQTGGRVGFFLHTDDFENDYKNMIAAGVYFEETPRHEPYGRVAVFNDPFGNRWDLLETTS